MDNIKGLLYGQALGDSVGLYNLTKKINYDSDCRWTNNTDQMICVVNMFKQNKDEINTISFASILQHWVLNGFSDIGQTTGDGCGSNTYSIVNNSNFTTDPIRVSRSHYLTGQSSNGSMIRAPIMGCRRIKKHTVLKDSITMCNVTHCELRCAIACSMITSIVYDIVNNVDDSKIWKNAYKCNYPGNPYHDEISRHCKAGSLDELNLDDKTMGYSLKSLAVVSWAWKQRARSYKDIITDIVLQGGDTSRNAAIVGGIIGCYKGFRNLPAEWLKHLQYKEFLQTTFCDLIETRPINSISLEEHFKKLESIELHNQLLYFERKEANIDERIEECISENLSVVHSIFD